MDRASCALFGEAAVNRQKPKPGTLGEVFPTPPERGNPDELHADMTALRDECHAVIREATDDEARHVKESLRKAELALSVLKEEGDLVTAQSLGRKAEKQFSEARQRILGPPAEKGFRFQPGRPPGALGALKRWLHDYLDHHGDRNPRIREIWNELRDDPQSEESGVAGCIIFAGKQQSRENVKNKLSEAKQERKPAG